MTEERLKVLEILKEGKINAEQAARLIEALNKTVTNEDVDDDECKVKIRVEKHDDENLDSNEEECRIEVRVEKHEDE